MTLKYIPVVDQMNSEGWLWPSNTIDTRLVGATLIEILASLVIKATNTDAACDDEHRPIPA